MSDIAIKVEHLTKTYRLYDRNRDRIKEAINPFGTRYSRDFYALNDISFEIKKGETIGIIGKNGAGKSTLLKILTGVLTPTSGKVEVNGKVAALLELGAGFNPEMTGIENIYLSGTIMGFSKEEMDEKVKDVIEFADIGEFINQPVRMYSSGMFARLAFSVNVAVEPSVLIIDEALSVGDDFFQQKCLLRMKQMQKKGVTILFVSHALGAIKALCETCIYLKNGKIGAYGSAEEVCSIYQNEDTDVKNRNLIGLEENLCTVKATHTEQGQSNFRVDEYLDDKVTERSGDEQLRLVAFDFLDKDNKIITTQEMFEPLRMNLSLVSKNKINEGTALGILCRNKMGIDIFAGNLNFYSIFLPEIKPNQKINIFVEFDIQLTPEVYFFGIGLKPDVYGNYFYDRCFNVAKIEISSSKKMKYPIGGIVYAKLNDFKMDVIE